MNIAVANEAMCEQCPCQQAIRRKHLHVCIQCYWVMMQMQLGHLFLLQLLQPFYSTMPHLARLHTEDTGISTAE